MLPSRSLPPSSAVWERAQSRPRDYALIGRSWGQLRSRPGRSPASDRPRECDEGACSSGSTGAKPGIIRSNSRICSFRLRNWGPSAALAENFSVVFALDAGFDPYSFRLSNGPGSAAANAGVPQNQQTAYSDSTRAGQWYNVGVSSPTYGTLTVFRQNSLTLDAVFDYDPFSASYAFSPIGFQEITCGGGNTENCRQSTSLKYRVDAGQFRVAALWQFGGYAQNNAFQWRILVPSRRRYPNVGQRCALDQRNLLLCQRFRVARTCAGNPRRQWDADTTLPQTLTATISDNSAVMFVAKCTTGLLKLFAGYENVRYMAPSDPQTAFTDITGNFVCQACATFNNTNINNTAFGVNGLGNKALQVVWPGSKYAVTRKSGSRGRRPYQVR
jgi:hypothetical protein